ncbi:hypothetical protein HDV05_005369 [Chytridiales sp. JEL 0842]|nr:hypothetical protein HDV05_005369 [Chytridiales sp. JEL 0842]
MSTSSPARRGRSSVAAGGASTPNPSAVSAASSTPISTSTSRRGLSVPRNHKVVASDENNHPSTADFVSSPRRAAASKAMENLMNTFTPKRSASVPRTPKNNVNTATSVDEGTPIGLAALKTPGGGKVLRSAMKNVLRDVVAQSVDSDDARTPVRKDALTTPAPAAAGLGGESVRRTRGRAGVESTPSLVRNEEAEPSVAGDKTPVAGSVPLNAAALSMTGRRGGYGATPKSVMKGAKKMRIYESPVGSPVQIQQHQQEEVVETSQGQSLESSVVITAEATLAQVVANSATETQLEEDEPDKSSEKAPEIMDGIEIESQNEPDESEVVALVLGMQPTESNHVQALQLVNEASGALRVEMENDDDLVAGDITTVADLEAELDRQASDAGDGALGVEPKASNKVDAELEAVNVSSNEEQYHQVAPLDTDAKDTASQTSSSADAEDSSQNAEFETPKTTRITRGRTAYRRATIAASIGLPVEPKTPQAAPKTLKAPATTGKQTGRRMYRRAAKLGASATPQPVEHDELDFSVPPSRKSSDSAESIIDVVEKRSDDAGDSDVVVVLKEAEAKEVAESEEEIGESSTVVETTPAALPEIAAAAEAEPTSTATQSSEHAQDPAFAQPTASDFQEENDFDDLCSNPDVAPMEDIIEYSLDSLTVPIGTGMILSAQPAPAAQESPMKKTPAKKVGRGQPDNLRRRATMAAVEQAEGASLLATPMGKRLTRRSARNSMPAVMVGGGSGAPAKVGEQRGAEATEESVVVSDFESHEKEMEDGVAPDSAAVEEVEPSVNVEEEEVVEEERGEQSASAADVMVVENTSAVVNEVVLDSLADEEDAAESAADDAPLQTEGNSSATDTQVDTDIDANLVTHTNYAANSPSLSPLRALSPLMMSATGQVLARRRASMSARDSSPIRLLATPPRRVSRKSMPASVNVPNVAVEDRDEEEDVQQIEEDVEVEVEGVDGGSFDGEMKDPADEISAGDDASDEVAVDSAQEQAVATEYSESAVVESTADEHQENEPVELSPTEENDLMEVAAEEEDDEQEIGEPVTEASVDSIGVAQPARLTRISARRKTYTVTPTLVEAENVVPSKRRLSMPVAVDGQAKVVIGKMKMQLESLAQQTEEDEEEEPAEQSELPENTIENAQKESQEVRHNDGSDETASEMDESTASAEVAVESDESDSVLNTNRSALEEIEFAQVDEPPVQPPSPRRSARSSVKSARRETISVEMLRSPRRKAMETVQIASPAPASRKSARRSMPAQVSFKENSGLPVVPSATEPVDVEVANKDAEKPPEQTEEVENSSNGDKVEVSQAIEPASDLAEDLVSGESVATDQLHAANDMPLAAIEEESGVPNGELAEEPVKERFNAELPAAEGSMVESDVVKDAALEREEAAVLRNMPSAPLATPIETNRRHTTIFGPHSGKLLDTPAKNAALTDRRSSMPAAVAFGDAAAVNASPSPDQPMDDSFVAQKPETQEEEDFLMGADIADFGDSDFGDTPRRLSEAGSILSLSHGADEEDSYVMVNNYNNVDVFELVAGDCSVLKRYKDSYINVSDIIDGKWLHGLEVDREQLEAYFKSGQHEVIEGRTRIAGIWVPMTVAAHFADEASITDELKPLFEATDKTKRSTSSEQRRASLSLLPTKTSAASPLSNVKNSRSARLSMPAYKLSELATYRNAATLASEEGTTETNKSEPALVDTMSHQIQVSNESTAELEVLEHGQESTNAVNEKPNKAHQFQLRHSDRRSTLSSSEIREIRDSMDRRQSLPPNVRLSSSAKTDVESSNITDSPDIVDSQQSSISTDGDDMDFTSLMADEPEFVISKPAMSDEETAEGSDHIPSEDQLDAALNREVSSVHRSLSRMVENDVLPNDEIASGDEEDGNDSDSSVESDEDHVRTSMELCRYDNVEVFELVYNNSFVLRRTSDGFVNSTNMLVMAGPSRTTRQTNERTKIIFNGIHDKCNSKTKLKGVWVPLASAIELAKLCNLEEILKMLFNADVEGHLRKLQALKPSSKRRSSLSDLQIIKRLKKSRMSFPPAKLDVHHVNHSLVSPLVQNVSSEPAILTEESPLQQDEDDFIGRDLVDEDLEESSQLVEDSQSESESDNAIGDDIEDTENALESDDVENLSEDHGEGVVEDALETAEDILTDDEALSEEINDGVDVVVANTFVEGSVDDDKMADIEVEAEPSGDVTAEDEEEGDMEEISEIAQQLEMDLNDEVEIAPAAEPPTVNSPSKVTPGRKRTSDVISQPPSSASKRVKGSSGEAIAAQPNSPRIGSPKSVKKSPISAKQTPPKASLGGKNPSKGAITPLPKLRKSTPSAAAPPSPKLPSVKSPTTSITVPSAKKGSTTPIKPQTPTKTLKGSTPAASPKSSTPSNQRKSQSSPVSKANLAEKGAFKTPSPKAVLGFNEQQRSTAPSRTLDTTPHAGNRKQYPKSPMPKLGSPSAGAKSKAGTPVTQTKSKVSTPAIKAKSKANTPATQLKSPAKAAVSPGSSKTPAGLKRQPSKALAADQREQNQVLFSGVKSPVKKPVSPTVVSRTQTPASVAKVTPAPPRTPTSKTPMNPQTALGRKESPRSATKPFIEQPVLQRSPVMVKPAMTQQVKSIDRYPEDDVVFNFKPVATKMVPRRAKLVQESMPKPASAKKLAPTEATVPPRLERSLSSTKEGLKGFYKKAWTMLAASPLKRFDYFELESYKRNLGYFVGTVFSGYDVEIVIDVVPGIARKNQNDPAAIQFMITRYRDDEVEDADRLVVHMVSVGRNSIIAGLQTTPDVEDGDVHLPLILAKGGDEMLQVFTEWLENEYGCYSAALKLTKVEMKLVLNAWFNWCGPQLVEESDPCWRRGMQLTLTYPEENNENFEARVTKVINLEADILQDVFNILENGEVINGKIYRRTNALDLIKRQLQLNCPKTATIEKLGTNLFFVSSNGKLKL